MIRQTGPNFLIISVLLIAFAFLAYPVLSGYSSPAGNQTATYGNEVVIAPGSSSPTNAKFFEPPTLNVPVGTTVTWKNSDSTLHTVTSGSNESGTGTIFDSSYVAAGKTFQHTFSGAGTFDYYCTLHPFMKGKIVVE